MDRGAWSSQSQGVVESDTTELLTLFTFITHCTSFDSLPGSTKILFFMALFNLEKGVSPAPDPINQCSPLCIPQRPVWRVEECLFPPWLCAQSPPSDSLPVKWKNSSDSLPWHLSVRWEPDTQIARPMANEPTPHTQGINTDRCAGIHTSWKPGWPWWPVSFNLISDCCMMSGEREAGP